MTVEENAEQYFTQFPRRSYAKGEILVFASENPEHIFYLHSGRVRKYDVSDAGDELVVNVFKAGAFFPMSWAINHSGNKFFYKAEAATVVRIVPEYKALEFLKANPDVMLDLLARLYRGMEGVLGRLVQLMGGSARSRVIYELGVECRRFGKHDAAGKYHLTITEISLAERSGLTRETVSRELQKLKKEGLVSKQTKGLVIDLVGLEKQLDVTN